jgi:SAM-dependent methyltransferase
MLSRRDKQLSRIDSRAGLNAGEMRHIRLVIMNTITNVLSLPFSTLEPATESRSTQPHKEREARPLVGATTSGKRMHVRVGGNEEARLCLHCESLIAYESKDHLHPWGVRVANGTNQRFCDKLYKLYRLGASLKVLDIGCGGGAFVRNLLDDGNLAIGIEGSDYALRWRRAEWRLIPEWLFTADFTKTVRIQLNDEPARFDAITAWEVLEHIKAEDVRGFMENVVLHLVPGGLFICSISDRHDFVGGVDLHETVADGRWWAERLSGFLERALKLERYFNTQWVRSRKHGYCGGYNFVFVRPGQQQSAIPSGGIVHDAVRWMYDRWLHTEIQKAFAGTCGNMNLR